MELRELHMSRTQTCPLCGFEYDVDGMACHTSCPMGSACSIICCPNCGYQIPDEQKSQIATSLQNLWGRFKRLRQQTKRDPNAPQTLIDLPLGQKAEVIEINSDVHNRLAVLSAYGVIPGSHIMLRRRAPAYVLVVDETEVALDNAVANEIVVRTT